MKKRYLKLSLGVAIFSIALSLSAMADWKQDATGYWWENADGSYPASAWQWLDGNGDGISECYYFNEQGYMLADTVTPDGCTVNADGAWVQDGVVMTKIAETKAGDGEASGGEAAQSDSAQSDSTQSDSAQSEGARTRTAAAPANEAKESAQPQSGSFKLGDLNVYMINDFNGGSVSSNLTGSYILKSSDGTKSAGIMMVDTSVNKTLQELVLQMESLGVNFNAPEMKETFIRSLNNSFVKLYGNEDAKCDSTYRTGTWRHLHYNEKQFYISDKAAPTDVYFNFRNKKSYTVIISGIDDPDQFMNNNISW